MKWFYLLKADELQEAINKRSKFYERYGSGSYLDDYYNLPKALRFTGPLQPLGELRGEKWLHGDWILSDNYERLKDIYAITLRLDLPFIFREGKFNIDYRDIVPKVTDKEWDKHYLGYLAGTHHDFNIEVDVFSETRVPDSSSLGVKPENYKQALMDFVEIFNQPDKNYKNLYAEIGNLDEDLQEIYHKYNMDEKYFLKQILDSETGQDRKIKLNEKSPKFIVIPKHVILTNNKDILRRLKL